MRILNHFTAYKHTDPRYHVDFPDITVAPNGDLLMIARKCGQWAYEATFAHGRPLTFFEAEAQMEVLRYDAANEEFIHQATLLTGLAFDPVIQTLSDGRIAAGMVLGEAAATKDRARLRGIIHRHIPQLNTVISVRGVGLFYSSDSGNTWTTKPVLVSQPGWENFYNLRKPTQLVDGTIILPAATGYPWRTRFVGALRSFDNGESFGDPAVAAEDPAGRAFYSAGTGFWQPAMVTLPSGDIVCVCIQDMPETTPTADSSLSKGLMTHAVLPKLFRCISRDSGYTWSVPNEMGLNGDFPSLVCKPDDGLVLTYVERTRTHSRVLVRTSRDAGVSWKDPFAVAFSEEAQHYYPNTVVLPDGTLMTAIMVSAPSKVRHIEAVLWSL